MARTVRQIGKKEKQAARVPAAWATVPEVDTRVALIQALIPVGLEAFHVELQRELVRWTPQAGYLGDQKLPVTVPRVRNRPQNREVPLTTYQQFQAPRRLDTGLLQRVLGGLATREYARCAEAVPAAFGMSASSVSRRFIRASARQLQALLERRLDAETFLALVIDGKTFAEDGMVSAVGVTADGRKVILGFVQTATENKRVCAAFLRGLVERGLRFEDGLLVVTDGAKGLHAAVDEVFGAAAVLQRCQWHQRENVVGYLPETHRPAIRRKLQAASEQPTYEAASRALTKVRQELRLLNASALASLEEGLEETLTLHRLGVFRDLGISLKTTNLLESIHARVEARVQKVDHWRNSDQKQRWLATALLDLEPQRRRIKNYQALPLLQHALRQHVAKKKQSAA